MKISDREDLSSDRQTGMDTLTKLYIEPTTACNLNCRMCVRHAWHDVRGTMAMQTYLAIMEQVADLDPPPTIHLGGYGEPMMHPNFLQLVKMAKRQGLRVEVTTNGSMLTRIVASALIDLKLDAINVSVDGAQPANYEDIRVGGCYGEVIENLRDLWRLKVRRTGRHGTPDIRLMFVAMKSNIEDLPRLPQLATHVGASQVLVSNLVPHTPAMERETLYQQALVAPTYRGSQHVVDVSLPKMDVNGSTSVPLHDVFHTRASISLLAQRLTDLGDFCRFAQDGYAAIRWDGTVHPCLSLMHDHPEYLHGRRREITHVTLGNVNTHSLQEIWQSPDYVTLRERLRNFDFSPCTTCGGCDRFAENVTDCTSEVGPTCGGCLWAQGFIQCP